MKAIKTSDLAQLFSVSQKTVRNYKNTETDHIKNKFIPYAGKHKMYRAMRLYYYLHATESHNNDEGVEVEIQHNNAEILLGNIEAIKTAVEFMQKQIQKTPSLQNEITKTMARLAEENIESALEIVERIRLET
jgi:hypothetical protein